MVQQDPVSGGGTRRGVWGKAIGECLFLVIVLSQESARAAIKMKSLKT